MAAGLLTRLGPGGKRTEQAGSAGSARKDQQAHGGWAGRRPHHHALLLPALLLKVSHEAPHQALANVVPSRKQEVEQRRWAARHTVRGGDRGRSRRHAVARSGPADVLGQGLGQCSVGSQGLRASRLQRARSRQASAHDRPAAAGKVAACTGLLKDSLIVPPP